MVSELEERLAEMGLEIPPPPPAAGSYKQYQKIGGLLFISGQLPVRDGKLIKGKVGDGLTLQQAREAAQLCALNILAQARLARGGQGHLGSVVRITGYVNSAPDFTDHPGVINAASDLLVRALGADAGLHTRVALGVASLPLGAAVEIDAIFG